MAEGPDEHQALRERQSEREREKERRPMTFSECHCKTQRKLIQENAEPQKLVESLRDRSARLMTATLRS